MLIISYDISDNKNRTKFSKFLSKYGMRLQYSVFQIRNSPTLLKNITYTIENTFKKYFTESDSVVIFQLSEICKITRYGYTAHNDSDIMIVT